jgi:hypothetical protein
VALDFGTPTSVDPDAIPSPLSGGPAGAQRTEKGGPCCKQGPPESANSIVPAVQKVRQMQSTDPLRNVNGEFPDDQAGALSAERWADILDVHPDRVVAMFREKNVPRKQIGKRIYVRPADLWGAFPFLGEAG